MIFINENNRIFAEDVHGEVVAEIMFPAVSESKVDIIRTFVHSSLRGQGIANILMQKVVDDIQSRNLKATASCSYAQKWFQDHPEYSDLLSD